MKILSNISRKINKNVVMILLLVCILIPYTNTFNPIIFRYIKVLDAIIFLFILSRESIMGFLSSIFALCIIINEYSKTLRTDSLLDYGFLGEKSIFKQVFKFYTEYFPNRYFIVIVTILMMLWVLFSLNRLFRKIELANSKYKFVNKFNKIVYKFRIVVPFIAYLTIINTVISCFANMYSSYYNDYYLKYALLDSSDNQNTIEELTPNAVTRKYIIHHKDNSEDDITNEIVTLNYDYSETPAYYLEKKQTNPESFQYELKTKKDVNFAPDNIEVEVKYKNGKTGYKHINKSFKFLDEKQDMLGTIDQSTFLYFSKITFFTIGYGDIVPTDYDTRNLVGLEALTAHILSAIFIPILFIIVQEIFNKKDKKSTDFNKLFEGISEGYIIDKDIKDGKEFEIRNKKFTISIIKHKKE